MERWGGGGLSLKSGLGQGCHAQLQTHEKIWNLSETSFLPKEIALKCDDDIVSSQLKELAIYQLCKSSHCI